MCALEGRAPHRRDLVDEHGVVAARLALRKDVVGDLVGGLASAEDPDIGGTAIAGDPDQPVILRADAMTPHHHVVTAMDVMGQIGISNISIATTLLEDQR